MEGQPTDKTSHPDLLAEHLNRPRNIGAISSGPRGRGIVTQHATGDALRLSVHIEGGRVVEARFRSFGNPVLRACASFITEQITGQEVNAAAAISVEQVADVLLLPRPHFYCAQMVLFAMLQAFQDYRRRVHVGVSA